MSANFTEMSITEFRKELPEVVNRVELLGTHVILTRYAKPRAAIVPVSVLEAILQIEDKIDMDALLAALNDKDEEWADDEEFWKELGL